MTTLADTCILRRSEVLARVGLSQATLYRLISRGMFPRPVRVSTRRTGWRSDEVEEWPNSRQHTVPESPGRERVPAETTNELCRAGGKEVSRKG